MSCDKYGNTKCNLLTLPVLIHNDTGHKCICSVCKDKIKECPICRDEISICCKISDPYITANNIKVY